MVVRTPPLQSLRAHGPADGRFPDGRIGADDRAVLDEP